MPEERRRSVRRKTLKGGRIVFHSAQSTIACTIRDLSDGGAKLQVTSAVGVPDEFTLAFDDGSASKRCSVRHRTATNIGVEFVVEFH
jgi:PilZ domain